MPLLCINMKEVENYYPKRESFPTNCEKCGNSVATEKFRGKGMKTDKKPLGHQDPRHDLGLYCSIPCLKNDNTKGGTIYKEA